MLTGFSKWSIHFQKDQNASNCQRAQSWYPLIQHNLFTIFCYKMCTLLGIVKIKVWNMPSNIQASQPQVIHLRLVEEDKIASGITIKIK